MLFLVSILLPPPDYLPAFYITPIIDYKRALLTGIPAAISAALNSSSSIWPIMPPSPPSSESTP
jgi:hypothetical protein